MAIPTIEGTITPSCHCDPDNIGRSNLLHGIVAGHEIAASPMAPRNDRLCATRHCEPRLYWGVAIPIIEETNVI
ncbi:MAG: hypothetical protein PHG36_11305 [Dehalococcoidia bacterium]|nr:hypothetical protein [Dehalococcoidia bacterium]